MGAFDHPAYSHEGHGPVREALQREFDNLAPGMFFDLDTLRKFIDEQIQRAIPPKPNKTADALAREIANACLADCDRDWGRFYDAVKEYGVAKGGEG
jgi:hypothetical protein